MLAEGRGGGPLALRSGTGPQWFGNDSEGVVSDGHARFYQPAYNGRLFTFGSGPTAIVATNAVGTTGATSQPVIGLWNPATSVVNLVVVQVNCVIGVLTASAVNPQGLYWMVSLGNAAITTGSVGFNCKSLAQTSVGRAYSMGTALTGKTNANVTMRPSPIILTFTVAAATAVNAPGNPTENVDGGIIIPPGAYAGLHTGVDASSNAMTLSPSILWEEVPV